MNAKQEARYLNPNCRSMLNGITCWRDAPGTASDGTAGIIASRFQVDF